MKTQNTKVISCMDINEVIEIIQDIRLKNNITNCYNVANSDILKDGYYIVVENPIYSFE